MILTSPCLSFYHHLATEHMSLSFVVEVLERLFSWFWKISSIISFISTILFLLQLYYILPIPCYVDSKLYTVPLHFDVLLKHRGGSNKRTIASCVCRKVLRGHQGLREQDLGFPLLGTHWFALYHYIPSSKFTKPPLFISTNAMACFQKEDDCSLSLMLTVLILGFVFLVVISYTWPEVAIYFFRI